MQSPSAQLSDSVPCSVTPLLQFLIIFIFEFVFSKRSLKRQQRMCVSRGAARAMGHTHTFRPVGTAGSMLKGPPGRISAQVSDSDGGSSGGVAGSSGRGPRGVRGSSWKQRQDCDGRGRAPPSPEPLSAASAQIVTLRSECWAGMPGSTLCQSITMQ